MTKAQQEERVCADRAQIVANFLVEALKFYHSQNKCLPTQVIVYRDGVGGPSYHEKVSRLEMPLVEQAMT
jgi:hypothetical protein